MIGRAACFSGVLPGEGTLSDELRGHYDLQTHELGSPVEDEQNQESGLGRYVMLGCHGATPTGRLPAGVPGSLPGPINP